MRDVELIFLFCSSSGSAAEQRAIYDKTWLDMLQVRQADGAFL